MEKKELNSRVANWALEIQEFDCEVKHRPGTSMRHVDALSRYPNVFSVESEVLQRIRKVQKEDEACKAIAEVLKQKSYENFIIVNDILYKEVNGTRLLVVPKGIQKQVIQNIHEQGHISKKKVKFYTEQDYFIPNLDKKIDSVLSNCVACILASRKRGKQECFLNPIEKSDVPLKTYHLDHLGPLPSTAKNYRYLFVVVDAFSKFTWLYPVKSTTAEEVLKKLDFQSEIFGNPEQIITDKGAAFTSKAFENYCNEEKIRHYLTTTGVPRGNGQVERANQIIIEVLTKLSINDPLRWYKHVPKLQKTMNSTQSRSINKSPFEVIFGVKMKKMEDQNLLKVLEEEMANQFEEERDLIRVEAKKQIQKIQEENRRYYDRKRKPALRYKLGDLVAIRRTQFGPGLKLHRNYLGPYEIIKVKRNDRYEVKRVGNGEGPVCTSSSADYMKPWRSFEDESEEEELNESPGTDEDQDGRV